MVQLFGLRRPVAVGLFAVFAFFTAFTFNSAEARPRHHRYSGQSFQQFQEHRYQEYYGNYHRYGLRYAREADAHRYGHLYQRRADRVYRHGAERHAFRSRYETRVRRESARHRRVAHREPVRHVIRREAREQKRQAALLPQDGVSVQPSLAAPMRSQSTTSNVVAEARRYIGGNPTGRRSLWCARFMNMVLARSGYRTTGSDMASSFARYGKRVAGPQVGAIAVMSRGRRGGHVGVVSGIDARGNPIVVSGNHSRRVAEATYSRKRIYAYVMPN